MDSYFMDEVMGSWDRLFWEGDDTPRHKKHANHDFVPNPFHYHTFEKLTFIHQTSKAFLLEDENGRFWVPKSLTKHVTIRNREFTGYIWNKLERMYIQSQ